MSKKSIDKLFQEKLKDFRERPDDKVWDRIEVTLDERKKYRNIIPLWWKLGAIAASLALLLYLLRPFESPTPELPIITNSEKGQTPHTEKKHENTDPSILDVDNINTNKKDQIELTDIDVPTHGDENINTVASSNKTLEKEVSNVNKREKEQPYKASTTIISPSGTETIWSANEKSSLENDSEIATNLPLGTEHSDSTHQLVQNSSNQQQENKEVQTGKSNISSPIIPQDKSESNEAIVVADTTGTSKKKSIFDVLEDNDETNEVTGSKTERWSVEPSIAPVYFNSAGEGSSIAPSFVSNSKSGEVSLSYGVLVSYKVGKKWSVRSGLQKSNYGYSTNDISYTSTFGIVSIASFDNINYNTSSGNLSVQSDIQGKPIPGKALDATGKNPTRTGKMLQQFGYLEVPMEVNYALLDKKFGVDLIGGVSSLFLTDNSVTLESGDQNTELGDANNINSMNFSANIGFGLNYRLMPKVRLNIEPIFKYQLNTFSNTAGSFQPFSIGVYSGLNFKF